MRSHKFYVAETKHKGKGLFAKKEIRKGDIIFIREDEKAYTEEEMESSGLREGHFMQVGWDKFIHISPPGCYGNHSCDPNAGIKDNNTY